MTFKKFLGRILKLKYLIKSTFAISITLLFFVSLFPSKSLAAEYIWVTGTVYCYDPYIGSWLPIRGAEAKLFDSDPLNPRVELGTTYTNNNGEFIFGPILNDDGWRMVMTYLWKYISEMMWWLYQLVKRQTFSVSVIILRFQNMTI